MDLLPQKTKLSEPSSKYTSTKAMLPFCTVYSDCLFGWKRLVNWKRHWGDTLQVKRLNIRPLFWYVFQCRQHCSNNVLGAILLWHAALANPARHTLTFQFCHSISIGFNAIRLEELLGMQRGCDIWWEPNQNIVTATMAASLNHVCPLKRESLSLFLRSSANTVQLHPNTKAAGWICATDTGWRPNLTGKHRT